MKIIDAHVHSFGDGLQGVDRLLEDQKKRGYTSSCYLSCECMDDAAQNALAIYFKWRAPDHYIYGGWHYRGGQDPAAEVRRLYEVGFDGMKMVEHKPTVRRSVGKRFDDPYYDEALTWMEEKKMPLLAHVGDPVTFWDPEQIPAWAAAAGYDYSQGNDVTLTQLREETDRVLERHPGLPLILAHFYFMSGDREEADRWLAAHPSARFDLVAGTEMYFDFAKDPEGWRKFFLKYQDRLIYGTDNYNHPTETDRYNADVINRMEQDFLSQGGEIPVWDQSIRGIALPDNVRAKILHGNFEKLHPQGPRPLETEAAREYLQHRLSHVRLTEEEQKITKDVLRALSS